MQLRNSAVNTMHIISVHQQTLSALKHHAYQKHHTVHQSSHSSYHFNTNNNHSQTKLLHTVHVAHECNIITYHLSAR